MNPVNISRVFGGACVLFCCLLGTAETCLAQGNSDAPPIDVLKLKWEKDVRLPRSFDPSTIPTGGTFSDPGTRVSSSSPGTAASGAGSGTPAARTVGSNSATFPPTPARLPVFYVYSMRIRNSAEKEIEAIAWDYLFLDPDSGLELGRHQFLSYLKTAPNGTVTLKGQVRTPPVRIVRASNSEGPRARPLERAAIQCVLFADTTVWRNPSGRKGVCELLKNRETLLKQKPVGGQH
jgi:hypothetical protein